MQRSLAAALALACAMPGTSALAQDGGADVTVQGHVFEPVRLDPTDELVAGLTVPEGFTVGVFARDLLNPRIIAVGPDGSVYATRRNQGDVIRLADADGDGAADGPPQVVATRPGMHGIVFHGNRVYLATVKEVYVADVQPDGSFGPLEMIIGDLPDGGQHPNRTLFVGPDEMLYITVGSTCNACADTNPENATVLRATLDGESRTIFARGLRNTIGMGWHPDTGELWGMDHGIDWLGNEVQVEELNLLQQGRNYGWPYVYGNDEINPQDEPPNGITSEQWAAMSDEPALGYTAHAAPMQLVFYTGGPFPDGYDGDAFASMRGSWNRKPAAGYEVVRVHFVDGQPQEFWPFLGGFLQPDGASFLGRPVGLAITRDGALLVGDDVNGVIYRVAYEGGEGTAEAAAPPADVMQAQAAEGSGVPLALERVEAEGQISVTSPAFGEGQPIPPQHSEYYEGISPPLEWSAVDGAQSYALVMEDPDAASPKPFVHWVAWNIPAGTTSLPEGLQEEPRLTLPEGLLQGRTSRGSVGYVGPRPPVGDPPHHYHVQFFALDTVLSEEAVPPGADRDTLLAAMAGHVLAEGELVGTYQQTDPPLK